MDCDKNTEHERYDNRARSLLDKGFESHELKIAAGSQAVPFIYRSPYCLYEQLLERHINLTSDVLELGAGTGLHSDSLKKTGARAIASDISLNSLIILSKRIGPGVTVVVADMESLPFVDNSFDVVCCAGSLSYGDPHLVDAEILRVLRPGGSFICVDSLNHNPIYRLNRWIHYLKGNRTKSTLRRMPTQKRIQSISKGFSNTEIRFFGAASFLMPALASICGQKTAASVSDAIDRFVRVRWSAFKFVLLAKGRL